MATIWMPDFKPLTPSAYDDEFSDNSLSGAWTELDNNSVLTVAETDRGLVLTNAGTTGGLAGVFRAVPSGDWSIWTKVGKIGVNAVTWSWVGLFVAEDLVANPTTADIGLICFYYDASYKYIARLSLIEYNQTGLIQWHTLEDTVFPLDVYFRIRKVSTSIFYDFSTDGLGWMQLGSDTTMGVVHMGVGIHNATGSSEAAVFQFFRCDTSTPALTNVMSGRRIDPENPPSEGLVALLMHYKRLRQ